MKQKIIKLFLVLLISPHVKSAPEALKINVEESAFLLSEMPEQSASEIARTKNIKKFCSIIASSAKFRSLRVCGNAIISGNLSIGGILSVGGNSSFGGDIFADGDLSVAGAATFGGPISIGDCEIECTPAGLVFVTPTGTVPFGVVLESAQYVQLGAQPATVGNGEPFTYTTAVLTTPGITATTGVFNPPFTASGTVFTLLTPGRYEVSYQMNYPTPSGVELYLGSTIAGMVPLPYTRVGKNSPDGKVAGSVIVNVTTPSSFLSVVASPGNTAAIQPGPNSSTTNQGATTVSFKRIS